MIIPHGDQSTQFRRIGRRAGIGWTFARKPIASIDRCKYVGTELRDIKTLSWVETAPHDYRFV
jgi:hypothetical protein